MLTYFVSSCCGSDVSGDLVLLQSDRHQQGLPLAMRFKSDLHFCIKGPKVK